jgi:hypothetical protein
MHGVEGRAPRVVRSTVDVDEQRLRLRSVAFDHPAVDLESVGGRERALEARM